MYIYVIYKISNSYILFILYEKENRIKFKNNYNQNKK